MRKSRIALWIGSSLLALVLVGCGGDQDTKIKYPRNAVPVQWTYEFVYDEPVEEVTHLQRLTALEKRLALAERDLSVHLDMIRELNELRQEMEKRLEALEARPR